MDNYLETLEQDNGIQDTIAVWKNIFSISQIVKQSVVSHAASFSWFRREKKKFFISTKYFTKDFVSSKYHTTFVSLNKASKKYKKEITEEENFPYLTAKSPAAYGRNNSYHPPLTRVVLLRTSI